MVIILETGRDAEKASLRISAGMSNGLLRVDVEVLTPDGARSVSLNALEAGTVGNVLKRCASVQTVESREPVSEND